MTQTIESLKSKFAQLGKEVDLQFSKINKAHKLGKDASKLKVGYESKWSLFNEMDGFLRKNNINFFTNYGDQNIDSPFNI